MFLISMASSTAAAIGTLMMIPKKRRILDWIDDLAYHVKPGDKNLPAFDTISVETALNSRCTCDYDGDNKKGHWGTFNVKRKLPKKQIVDRVTELLNLTEVGTHPPL